VNKALQNTESIPSPASPERCRVAAARAVCFSFLAWLLAVFLLAIFFPGPGNLLRSISFPGLLSTAPNPLSHVILGGLLFCAGLTVESARMPRLKLGTYPASLLSVWGIPFLAVLLIGSIAVPLGVNEGIILGLILAVAMPVANASVGWTHLGGGNLPLILALLLGATVMAPITAPWMTQTLAGLCLSGSTPLDGVLPLNQIARFLGFWVVLPTVVGAVVGILSRKQGIVWSVRWLRRVSLTCLLLLNYINASLALPLIKSGSIVFQGLLCSTLLIGVLLLASWFFARLLKLGPAERISLSLACGMKNTGAALVLAGTQFQDEPAVLMTILLQALLQNLCAALLVSIAVKNETARPDDTAQIPLPSSALPAPESELRESLHQRREHCETAGS